MTKEEVLKMRDACEVGRAQFKVRIENPKDKNQKYVRKRKK